MDLKPYPAMKDTGVPRLEAVPKHWDVRRLGQIGRLSKGNGGNKDDEMPMGVPCVRYGDLYTTHTYFIRRSRSFVLQSTAERYTPIKSGDILFAASGETYEEIGKSAVNLMQSEACCGGDLILFRPEHPLEARYMGYATDCRPAAIQKAMMGRGITVKHIYGNQLKSLALALPPLTEQAAISRFLDHADRCIRRYIRAKQKLIALLEEQKQAIIHQAVTGQIDVGTGQPYPAYTPSGVEWLGGVPGHWEVRRMRHLVSTVTVGIQMGPFGASLTRLQHKDTGYKLYGQENTISGNFGRGSRWITQKQFKELQRYELLPGDLVLTRKGSIGKCRLATEDMVPGIIDSDTIRVRPDENLVLRGFVVLLFHQAAYLRQQIEVFQRGAVVGGLNTATIAALCVVVPPVREQAAIVRVITPKMATLNAAVDAVCCQIEHVKEYRTRLIADVVTGKLDVREAASGLPEVDPLAAEDDSDAVFDPEARLDGNELAVAVHDAEV